ncbi:MAG: sugar nucleotide-binding protein [Legionellaceae bacterium]|nr:sugar nucleotide-binding protein [Legionellaceae bacterium]
MKNALIIGIDSTIGNALRQELTTAGWAVFGTTRQKHQMQENIFYLDLEHVDAFHIELPLDVVFLCASVTKIATCRANPEYSQLINRDAQIALAQYFLNKSIHVIFLSTVAVFDGQKPAYRIDDIPNPTTIYGEHKAAAEQAIMEMSGKCSIVRLSKVLTTDYPLIMNWLDALKQERLIEPFHDLQLCPISINVVTYCLKEIARRSLFGIIHLSGEQDVTYLDVAIYLADAMNIGRNLIKSKSILEVGMMPNEVLLHTSLDYSESTKLFGNKACSLSDTLNEMYGTTWYETNVFQ